MTIVAIMMRMVHWRPKQVSSANLKSAMWVEAWGCLRTVRAADGLTVYCSTFHFQSFCVNNNV